MTVEWRMSADPSICRQEAESKEGGLAEVLNLSRRACCQVKVNGFRGINGLPPREARVPSIYSTVHCLSLDSRARRDGGKPGNPAQI
jgi:hypothetical protein